MTESGMRDKRTTAQPSWQPASADSGLAGPERTSAPGADGRFGLMARLIGLTAGVAFCMAGIVGLALLPSGAAVSTSADAASIPVAKTALGSDAAAKPETEAQPSVGIVEFSEMAELDNLTGLEASPETAPPDEGLFYRAYKVQAGDTISDIAKKYGVSTDSILTFNDIRNARTVQIGALLRVPNMNGILYTVKSGDTLAALAETYQISESRTAELNNLPDSALVSGMRIFLPDARLSSVTLREINGDLFAWPLRSYITSWYGWRNDPFTGKRAFHTGIDIGAPVGTSVRAAMEGRVSSTGYSATMGNYVILSHHSGYSTLYAHLSVISVKSGTWVQNGGVIGRVGNTGYSTGPHLHFTVRKFGVTLNPMTLLK